MKENVPLYAKALMEKAKNPSKEKPTEHLIKTRTKESTGVRLTPQQIFLFR